MKQIQLKIAVFLIAVITSLTAQASYLEVNSGLFSGTGAGGEGGGRGQGILADSTFSITSLGIYGDLIYKSFDVVIYSSTTGSDVGSVLASSSAMAGGTGNGWNDIGIDFTFNAGLYYVVNWRPTDLGISNWANTLDYYSDSALPVSIGPLTLIDGFSGTNAEENYNTLDPNFRYNIKSAAVPEPAALTLLTFGLAGLGFSRIKRKRI